MSIESVSGLTPTEELRTDTSITFYIHVKNIDNIPRYAITSNFRIYSPDGAVWGDTTIGDTIDFGWGSWGQMFDFGGFHIDYRHANGWGSDTVVFWGLSMFGSMPGYFDETSYSLTIGPIDESMEGRTICIDSCSFPPAGEWMWVDEDANSSKPPWHGPYCYTVGAMTEISYSGYLYYLDPRPPDTIPMPMRHIRIEMWDGDLWPNPDDLLAIDTTDDWGNFELGPVANEDKLGDLMDIYLKIYAENEAAYVTDDHNGDIHVIQTPEQPDLPSGDYDTTITASLTENGPFFIADAVLEAFDSWYYLTNSQADQVEVVSNIGDTSYFHPYDYYIRIAENQSDPDTYDKDVIFHEYAHYLEDIFGFCDLGAEDHDWCAMDHAPIAATEGFAMFLPCLIRDDPILRNTFNDFNQTWWVNLENGTQWVDTTRECSANNYGDSSEAAVAGILWDIYDDADDDYHTYKWPPDPIPNDSNPDGIGDSLTNGHFNILNVLLNRDIDGHHPDIIDEFWQAWFQSPSLDHSTAIRHIWYEHGIPTCGDANADAAINVADAVFLIGYIFLGGPAPDKLEAGDVDGYPSINIGDAVYIINYMFKEGPPPCGIQ